MIRRVLVLAGVAGLVLGASFGWPINARLLPSKARLKPSPYVEVVHAEQPEMVRVGFLKPGGGYTIETIPLETYVARVLAGEAARGSRPAALEALAITVRTFALSNRSRHRADGFDLCDQTHCQVVRAATPATERAAAATAGRILLRDAAGGAPASIYYTASCGGRSELPSAVWPGAEDPPFLPSKADDACEGGPVWSAELNASDILRALRAAGFQGDRLKKLSIGARNRSGRVARLKVDGLEPDEISGQDFRVAVGRALGWQLIKSTAFDLHRSGNAYRFNGHGYGHGVGLCVIGSARLAETGSSADTILARYFPGLTIGTIGTPARATTTARAAAPALPTPSVASPALGSPGRRPATAPTSAPDRAPAGKPEPGSNTVVGPEIAVSLPDGDEGERDVVQSLTVRARDDLARRLGVTAPRSITVRFHSTTDDYERATGQAWFTSGAVVGGELHLLPVAVLRERGVLERTIRHELVHLLTDAALAGRPAWVREGAAIYYGGGGSVPPAVRQWPPFKPSPGGNCPSDAELMRPVSVGALANAYARAHACFAKQVNAGRKWTEVR